MRAAGFAMMVGAGVALMGGFTVVGFVEGGTLVGGMFLAMDALLVGWIIALVGLSD